MTHPSSLGYGGQERGKALSFLRTEWNEVKQKEAPVEEGFGEI
ncbi:MAG: hypothetical protein ABIE14_03865 [Patescibacteria group bacterium]